MTPPMGINVFIFPGDRSSPSTSFLPTIDTSTESPPPSLSFTLTVPQPGSKGYPPFHYDSHFCNSDLPEFPNQLDPRRSGHWTNDAWADRVILDMGDYHLLTTLAMEGLPNNKWTFHAFHGDAFVLKPSSTVSTDGVRGYENILDGMAPEQEESLLADFLIYFRKKQIYCAVEEVRKKRGTSPVGGYGP